METLYCLTASLRSMFRDRRELALENLALRQQLAILARAQSHRRLRKKDRLFWVWISRIWERWRESLIVVRPETLVRWHRKGFALYWTSRELTIVVARESALHSRTPSFKAKSIVGDCGTEGIAFGE